MSCQRERVHKLVELAESGKYEKAVGKLKDTNKDNCFCILGLACENYRLVTGEGYWEGNEFYTGKETEKEEDYDDYGSETIVIPEYAEDCLPETVREWYGFSDTNPFDIIRFNDGDLGYDIKEDEYSLPALAKMIEEKCQLQQ